MSRHSLPAKGNPQSHLAWVNLQPAPFSILWVRKCREGAKKTRQPNFIQLNREISPYRNMGNQGSSLYYSAKGWHSEILKRTWCGQTLKTSHGLWSMDRLLHSSCLNIPSAPEQNGNISLPMPGVELWVRSSYDSSVTQISSPNLTLQSLRWHV